MLTLQISKAEIAMLKYEIYYNTDALVQKRLHYIYLKSIDPQLSCQKIGLFSGLSRQKVSIFIKLYNKSGIQILKYNNYGTNESELWIHSQTLLLKSKMPYKPISIVLDNDQYQHYNFIKELAQQRR